MTIVNLPEHLGPSDPPGLTNGYVTFGVFNRATKVSDGVLALWARILKAVPRSRILMKHYGFDDPETRGRMVKKFVSLGIAAHRVAFLGKSSRGDHIAAFKDVDISLDPFPHNGGISTLESLQMGVPVVAMLGTAIRAARPAQFSPRSGSTTGWPIALKIIWLLPPNLRPCPSISKRCGTKFPGRCRTPPPVIRCCSPRRSKRLTGKCGSSIAGPQAKKLPRRDLAYPPAPMNCDARSPRNTIGPTWFSLLPRSAQISPPISIQRLQKRNPR